MMGNKLDDFIGYMYSSGMLDENFGLKEDEEFDEPECPICGSELIIKNDNLYCKNCDKYINDDNSKLKYRRR